MESRLIGQEAAKRRPRTGRAPGVTDRAPEGWSWGVAPTGYSDPETTHSSPLAGASGARFAVSGSPLAVGGLLQGPRITHPVYPPGPHPPGTIPRYRTSPPHHTTGLCHTENSTFGHRVGEPRGMRTHRCFRVPDWFIDVCWFYTAV